VAVENAEYVTDQKVKKVKAQPEGQAVVRGDRFQGLNIPDFDPARHEVFYQALDAIQAEYVDDNGRANNLDNIDF
jgi:hypothetical protein